ncbi:hypothetical protein E2320_009406, partial [Naja naja]
KAENYFSENSDLLHCLQPDYPSGTITGSKVSASIPGLTLVGASPVHSFWKATLGNLSPSSSDMGEDTGQCGEGKPPMGPKETSETERAAGTKALLQRRRNEPRLGFGGRVSRVVQGRRRLLGSSWCTGDNLEKQSSKAERPSLYSEEDPCTVRCKHNSTLLIAITVPVTVALHVTSREHSFRCSGTHTTLPTSTGVPAHCCGHRMEPLGEHSPRVPVPSAERGSPARGRQATGLIPRRVAGTCRPPAQGPGGSTPIRMKAPSITSARGDANQALEEDSMSMLALLLWLGNSGALADGENCGGVGPSSTPIVQQGI